MQVTGATGQWTVVAQCGLGCSQGACNAQPDGGASAGACCGLFSAAAFTGCAGNVALSCVNTPGACNSGMYGYVWRVRETCSLGCSPMGCCPADGGALTGCPLPATVPSSGACTNATLLDVDLDAGRWAAVTPCGRWYDGVPAACSNGACACGSDGGAVPGCCCSPAQATACDGTRLLACSPTVANVCGTGTSAVWTLRQTCQNGCSGGQCN